MIANPGVGEASLTHTQKHSLVNMIKRLEIQEGPVHWWLRHGSNVDAVRPLVRQALDALASGELHALKIGRKKALYMLTLIRDGAPDYLLKVNHYPSPRGILRRMSKARHELSVAEEMVRRGLSTPIPLAAGEQYEGRRLVTCFLLMPILDDVVDLWRLWFVDKLSGVQKHALATVLGKYTRRVHDAGLFQDDFAPNNFLIRRVEPFELFLIDLERARIRARTSKKARRWMLAKLDRGLARASLTDRLRFLHAYAAGDRAEARRWWHVVRRFAPRMARHDVRRVQRNVSRGGGRTRPIASEKWKGYARADISDVALESMLGIAAAGHSGGVRVASSGGAWIVPIPGQLASYVWGAASTLALRGLCPRPLGVLCHDSATLLFLEYVQDASLLATTKPDHNAEGALRALFARLFGYGNVADTLDSHGIVVSPTNGKCLRASLLRVDTFLFGSAVVAEFPRRVDMLTRRLLKQIESNHDSI